MTLIIFMGIQGSGKSTFYEENFKNTFVRVNLDTLKTRKKEEALFKACLAEKENIVIDNTNPTVIDRQRYLGLTKNAGYLIHGYYFNTDLEESLKRNASRDRVVPRVGILGTLNKFERPSYKEGFDKLYFVKIDLNKKFIVEDWKI